MQNCFELFSSKIYLTVVAKTLVPEGKKIGQNRPPKYGTIHVKVNSCIDTPSINNYNPSENLISTTSEAHELPIENKC